MPLQHRTRRQVARGGVGAVENRFQAPDAGHVDAVQDHGELGGGQLDPGGGGFGEVVAAGFQTLAPQAETVTAPVQHLHADRGSVGENE